MTVLFLQKRRFSNPNNFWIPMWNKWGYAGICVELAGFVLWRHCVKRVRIKKIFWSKRSGNLTQFLECKTAASQLSNSDPPIINTSCTNSRRWPLRSWPYFPKIKWPIIYWCQLPGFKRSYTEGIISLIPDCIRDIFFVVLGILCSTLKNMNFWY